MSETFPIKKGLKLGDALLPLLFNFALEYATRCVQVNLVGFKLNGTHQFLVYADDVNISGRSILTMQKNTAALLVNSKETGLEVYTEKMKYMVMSAEQNAGQNHNINTGYKSF